MTEKLYEENAYVKEFTAKVLECKASDNFYKIVLDKTAFFPEGGGQASDMGVLDETEIFDVQIEDKTIYHYAKEPIKVGSEIIGKIFFERRFFFMQNHTGEHIVSGIAHRYFGVNNVGFHLSEDFVTVDFDKELSREQLNIVEYLANQTVWQNLPVRAYFPTEEELEKTEYRSKKEIDGAVRLVEIKDTDICACCAPHVKNTGEIGVIKLLDTEKMRGGIRIIIKCGNFALQDYQNKYQNVSQISTLLSSKQEKAYEAVQKLDEKCTAASQKITELKKKIADMAVSAASQNDTCIFVDGCDVKELQLLADKLHKKFGGIRAVFSENTGNFSFAICAEDDELQELFAKFKSQFTVRGGGRGGMVQGTVEATSESINLFFEF